MLKHKNQLLAVLLSALLVSLSGCTGGEYIPRSTFEIRTESGEIITLACPVVDAGRSELSYIIDGDCVVYKKAN